jgi:hypothetical protein
MSLPRPLQHKTNLWHCWIFHGGIRRSCRFRLLPRIRIDGGIHFYWLMWCGWVSVNRRKIENAIKNSS